MNCLYEGPLDTYLKENPHLRRIVLCLDADGPGREAAERMNEKYTAEGYSVTSFLNMQGDNPGYGAGSIALVMAQDAEATVRYAGAVGGSEPCCTGYRAGQWDEDLHQVPVGPLLYSGGCL